jgi:hypothetical protein
MQAASSVSSRQQFNQLVHHQYAVPSVLSTRMAIIGWYSAQRYIALCSALRKYVLLHNDTAPEPSLAKIIEKPS